MEKVITKKWNFDPYEGYKGNLLWIPSRTIFVGVHGSQAYGTSTPESDIDIKGLCVAPKEYYLGYTKTFEQLEGKDPYDMVIYGLPKFMKLASACNPNIIEILNIDPSDWVIETKLFRKLWEHRDLFLSKLARNTFFGYATAQLKRIKSHRNWLLEPPTHKPTREEFGLPEQSKLSQSDLGATQKLVDEGIALESNVMLLFQKEMKYQSAKRTWDQYQSWKQERNVKRAELEAKFHYDSKHAMHLVRLLLMCKEILTEGKVIVKRPDAKFLLSIRNGEWSYEKLISWTEEQEGLVDELYNKSPLPDEPDRNKLDVLCQELTEEALSHADLRY
jgi:hypothetical protein